MVAYKKQIVVHIPLSGIARLRHGLTTTVHHSPIDGETRPLVLHLTEVQHHRMQHHFSSKGKAKLPTMSAQQVHHHRNGPHYSGAGGSFWSSLGNGVLGGLKAVGKAVAPHALDAVQGIVASALPGTAGQLLNRAIGAGREHFGVGVDQDGGAILLEDQYGGSFRGEGLPHQGFAWGPHHVAKPGKPAKAGKPRKPMTADHKAKLFAARSAKRVAKGLAPLVHRK